MALADQLATEQQKAQHPPLCSVRRLMHDLEPEDATTLNQALTSDYQHAVIARALTAEGYKISSQAISRHRRGLCACR